ncbi:sensor histidine kinase [Angustibacter aerolatus]
MKRPRVRLPRLPRALRLQHLPPRQVLVQLAVWLPALAATAIAFGTAGETYDVARTTWGPMPFVGAIVGLPLLTVVSRPLVGWAVSAVAAVLLPAVLPVVDADPWRWQTMHGLVLLALLLAVCAREPLRAGAGAWLVTLGLFLWGTKTDIAAAWVVPVTVVAVIGWLVGRLVRARRALSVQAEVSSAEKARRLVLEERQRIARDLHDVVAHHMSLVVVQAETAPYRVPGLDDGARTELSQIAESARAALSETRALLSVLRDEDADADLTPQPGIERIGELVDGARRAGLQVDADVRVLVPLRQGTSMAAYRVVQESLANAARHAPRSVVRLMVQSVDDGLEVLVQNSIGEGAAADGPAGHGLVGMRERVTAEGGRLEVGPLDDATFRVRALMPVATAQAVQAVQA